MDNEEMIRRFVALYVSKHEAERASANLRHMLEIAGMQAKIKEQQEMLDLFSKK